MLQHFGVKGPLSTIIGSGVVASMMEAV